MKTGLVLEGGAMRGIYSAGVMDNMFNKNISFDGIIGVSAGAVFGVNYISRQPGRVIRYNKKYNMDKNYMGIGNLIKSGNIVNTEYAYYKVPKELDVFDNDTFMKSGIPFYAVITNIENGKPEYVKITDPISQMETLRASASMPFVSKPVELDGGLYLDGAVTDSIPYEKFLEMGYDRLVVILTKDIDYVKKPIPPFLCDMYYKKKYPLFNRKVKERHIMYNETIKRLKLAEGAGEIFVIRPSKHIDIKKLESDPQKLQSLYELGIKDCNEVFDELLEYLNA